MSVYVAGHLSELKLLLYMKYIALPELGNRNMSKDTVTIAST